MRVLQFVYDSATAEPHVPEVLDLIERRDGSPELLDVATADDEADARREAMLTVRAAVRIGSTPDELFDDDGDPDFSAGALITEEPTGRRSLHVGEGALEALREDEGG